MKRVLPLLALIIYLFTSSFISSEDRWFCEDQKYSYQLEIYNSRSQIQVQSDFCDYLTLNRKASEDNYIQLYPNVRLIIFSQKKIDKGLETIPQIIYKN
jgi:hypothetical protein